MGMTGKGIDDTSRSNGDAKCEDTMTGMTSGPSTLKSKDSNTVPSGETTDRNARCKAIVVEMRSMEGSNGVTQEDEDGFGPNRRIMPGTFPMN